MCVTCLVRTPSSRSNDQGSAEIGRSGTAQKAYVTLSCKYEKRTCHFLENIVSGFYSFDPDLPGECLRRNWCAAACWSSLQRVAACCSVLSVLQCVATWQAERSRRVWGHDAWRYFGLVRRCRVCCGLYCSASCSVCCSMGMRSSGTLVWLGVVVRAAVCVAVSRRAACYSVKCRVAELCAVFFQLIVRLAEQVFARFNVQRCVAMCCSVL